MMFEREGIVRGRGGIEAYPGPQHYLTATTSPFNIDTEVDIPLKCFSILSIIQKMTITRLDIPSLQFQIAHSLATSTAAASVEQSTVKCHPWHPHTDYSQIVNGTPSAASRFPGPWLTIPRHSPTALSLRLAEFTMPSRLTAPFKSSHTLRVHQSSTPSTQNFVSLD